MDDIVVDTSVAVKWVLQESDSTLAWQVKRETEAKNGTVCVLDYALVEAANAIWSRQNRKLITAVEANSAFTALNTFTLGIVTGETLLPSAFELAIQFNIAVYDALFVAAVKELNCRGVTADERLVTAVEASFPQIVRLNEWK